MESRTAYFSTPPLPPAVPVKPTIQQRIDRAALSEDVLAGITADISAAAENDTIQIVIRVDTTDLRFVERDGKYIQQLTFSTVLEDASGSSIEGKQSVMDLDVSKKTLAELRAKGLDATVSLRRVAASAGPWKVREVIREAAENRIGAWTINGPVE